MPRGTTRAGAVALAVRPAARTGWVRATVPGPSRAGGAGGRWGAPARRRRPGKVLGAAVGAPRGRGPGAGVRAARPSAGPSRARKKAAPGGDPPRCTPDPNRPALGPRPAETGVGALLPREARGARRGARARLPPPSRARGLTPARHPRAPRPRGARWHRSHPALGRPLAAPLAARCQRGGGTARSSGATSTRRAPLT